MSRAAFLPTPGDPCLLTLWFKYYKRWASEVDRLYVYVNSDSPRPIIQYIKGLVDSNPNTFFIYIDHQIEHGEALRQMVQLSTEDYIMFVEDDGFIFKPGQVNHCFSLIETSQYDVIGSQRGSCSLWLYNEASERWGIDNSGLGDHGPNFWPNFFFAKRTDLLKVTNFASKFWRKGDYVWALDQYAPEDQASDTFVEGSLELRAMGLRIGYVPQFHGNTDDEPDYEAKVGIWGPDCSWFHVGSLSSGYHGMLKPGYKLNVGTFSTPQEKLELERRICFYQLAFDEVPNTPQTRAMLKDYQSGIMRLVDGYALSPGRIQKRMAMYKEVMG